MIAAMWSGTGARMVKIIEVTDPFPMGNWWVVFSWHIGAEGYDPNIYPCDINTGLLLPPWDPDYVPDHGHLLYTPYRCFWGDQIQTFRRFDEFLWVDGVESEISNEPAAWNFFYEMLGHPYRFISRCRYCFPHGHRYLVI